MTEPPADKPLSSRDISRAPLLHARAAARCPVRTHNDIDPPGDTVPVAFDESTQVRIDQGRAFEDEVMSVLGRRHGPIPSFVGDPAGAAKAMAEGVPLLAQVPLVDEVGRRTGRPDLLLATDRLTEAGRRVYLPVDVKHHKVATPAKEEGEGTLRAVPFHELPHADVAALPQHPTLDVRRRNDDLFTIAHYHRLLEAAGHAGEPLGIIIGSEGLAALLDLEAFAFNSWRNMTGRWTTLQAYDREFGFRLDIAVVAADRAGGRSSDDPVVVPARSTECARCPWEPVCAPRMEAADELTLLPGIGWRERQELRAQGVDSRAALAAQDPEGQRTTTLGKAIDHARMVGAGIAIARRRGVVELDLPRADVEVDVDMESTSDGVYLWGNLVVRRDDGRVVDTRYQPFSDLTPEPDHVAVFRSFWTWLTGLQAAATSSGRTFAAYFWSPAETRWIRTYADATGTVVEAFLRSPAWIDLEAVVKRHALTAGGRSSLKVIAPLAGFSWRDPEAGGDASTLWFHQAAAGDASAARRLLDYNTDDVRATLAVREWLQGVWPDLPAMEDLRS